MSSAQRPEPCTLLRTLSKTDREKLRSIRAQNERCFTESLDIDLDARVNAVAPFLIDVKANREAMPETDYSEWTSSDAVVDEIVHLLTNFGLTG